MNNPVENFTWEDFGLRKNPFDTVNYMPLIYLDDIVAKTQETIFKQKKFPFD